MKENITIQQAKVTIGFPASGISRKLVLLFPAFLALVFLFSCNIAKDHNKTDIERYIDSLNVEFSKDVMQYDSLKITEIEKLIRISDSINYPEGMAHLAITAARIYYFNFQNKESLDMLNIANMAMLKTGDKRLEALVNLYFGVFNSRISSQDVALEFYLKAMQLSLEAMDSTTYAKSLTQIGSLYMESGYLDKAKEYFNQSIEINTKIKNLENLAIDYHRMSLYHMKKNELDSAKFYLESELKTTKESGNVLLYIYNLNNMANTQILIGAIDLGEQYSMEALSLMDSISPFISPSSAKSVIYANLGMVNQKKGNYENALHYFEMAYADSLYNTDQMYRMGLIFEIYQTHKYLGNYKLADTYLQKYLNLRNLHDKTVAKQNLLDMEMRYNFKQIQNNNEHKQLKMRLLFYSILVVLGLSIFILVLFIQKQRIKIKNEKLHKDIQELKLDKLNRELASQALNIARMNERNNNMVKTLKDRLPNFTPENQTIVSDIIVNFEKDKNESAWNEFEVRFTSVHGDFYKKLSKINPNLTLNEKRLCAFLLLDMTTKEISAITGQSIRAIELARIRLRKQFGLTNSNVTLTSFLSNL